MGLELTPLRVSIQTEAGRYCVVDRTNASHENATALRTLPAVVMKVHGRWRESSLLERSLGDEHHTRAEHPYALAMMTASTQDRIELVAGETRVVIVPRRGGIASRFDIGSYAVLYLDEVTLADPAKNVRGGIPVLFPTPGKLADDAWSFAGKRGGLKQHGFARNEVWQVIDVGRGAAPRASLRLEWAGNADNWPWPTALEITYALRGQTLRLDQRVTNLGGERMPFGLGFHPYFHVPVAEKTSARVTTRATQAFDNVAKRVVQLAHGGDSIDLADAEVDLHLLDHGSTESELRWSSHVTRIRGSAEFTRWVIWTLPGRSFVCLEPWTCPGNALNTGDGVLFVEPGATVSTWVEIDAST
jgi:galactose mutarotase-like enzyme